MDTKIKLTGRYDVHVVSNRGQLLHAVHFCNAVTNEGKNHILDTFLGAQAKATWYFGLITNGGTLAAADTLASHAGWTEVSDCADNRVEAVYTYTAASGVIVSDYAIFVAEAEFELGGVFLCNVSSGTAGKLFSTGLVEGFTVPDEASVSARYSLTVTQPA